MTGYGTLEWSALFVAMLIVIAVLWLTLWLSSKIGERRRAETWVQERLIDADLDLDWPPEMPSDLRLLYGALGHLRNVLEHLLTQPHTLQSEMLREFAAAAWRQQCAADFDRLLQAVATPSPRFRQNLAAAGLTDEAARFKIAAYYYLAARSSLDSPNLTVPGSEAERRRWDQAKNGARPFGIVSELFRSRRAKSVLKAGDIILESVCAALPDSMKMIQLGGHGIAEVKQTVELLKPLRRSLM